jgi:SAM-dependent methyltransferase
MDWTQISKDPNNDNACSAVSNYLREITRRYDGGKSNYVSASCLGKKMLDIGAGEHDPAYFNVNWEHAIYKKSALGIVAIEIEKDLCDFYNEKGFDFRCLDATSDVDMGEKFDFVYCGDVIEHVENPVALIKFAARHMMVGALCIISTPNPTFVGYHNACKARGDLYFIANLQHTSWITPTNMLEIIRRTGLGLTFDQILIPEHAYQAMVRYGGVIEKYFDEYVYILRKE